jgi:hypothetical protein
MNELKGTGFNDRLTNQADAKKALLAKFKPKPTVTAAETPADRDARRAAEKEAVRLQRLAEKTEREAAKAASAEAVRQRQLEAEEVAAAEVRSQRKERKALTKQEQKERRDAKYAARKARR